MPTGVGAPDSMNKLVETTLVKHDENRAKLLGMMSDIGKHGK